MIFAHRKKHKNHKKGFTLIELLIVIAIIGILSGVVLSSLRASQFKADDSRRYQDLQQVKTALELYLGKHSYTLPTLAVSGSVSEGEELLAYTETQTQNSIKTSKIPVGNFLTQVAQADTTHTDPACVRFDQLATILVNEGFLPRVPQDPQDTPADSCYKAFTIDTDNDSSTIEAITAYTYLWEKYTTQTNGVYGNKKVGFIVAKGTDITGTLTAQVCSATGEYPILDLSSASNLCLRNQNDTVADIILGVTKGEEYASNIDASDSASDSGSASDSASASDNSSASDSASAPSGHCSNPIYTNEVECIRDRSYCDDSTYTDQYLCTLNGHYANGTCSDPAYTNEQSCISNGSYLGGYCSDNSYSDENSCINAGYWTGPVCSNPAYIDQTECEQYGGTWSMVFQTYGYTWYNGTWTPNTWYSGLWVTNTWYSIPPSTWYNY